MLPFWTCMKAVYDLDDGDASARHAGDPAEAEEELSHRALCLAPFVASAYST